MFDGQFDQLIIFHFHILTRYFSFTERLMFFSLKIKDCKCGRGLGEGRSRIVVVRGGATHSGRVQWPTLNL